MIEIGSSDAPVILGVSPHTTPWQLWARLVGLVERVDEPDEVMRAGSKIEAAVVDMLLEEIGAQDRPVSRSPQTRVHEGWMRDTPDALVTWPDALDAIEVKCVVGQAPPTPRVEWVVQCLHHLLAWRHADRCHLAAFGGLRLVRWELPRHQAALERVLRAEEAFLELVEKETPPPVVAADCSGLWRGWPLVADRSVALPEDAHAWDAMRVGAARDLGDARERLDLANARIKAAMGDARYGVLGAVTYTWSADKRGVRSLRRKERNGE